MDAERFPTFCEKNRPGLWAHIKIAILSCLDTLRFTGVDSGGKLLALTRMQGSMYIAESSRDIYTWSDILQDTEEAFTVAVVTNTCLSSLPSERCANSADTSEGSLILATWIITRIGIPGSSPEDLALSKNNGENYHLTHGANPLELFIGPDSKSHLKLLTSISEEGEVGSLSATRTRKQPR